MLVQSELSFEIFAAGPFCHKMILILISLLFPLIFGKSANPIIRVKTTEGTVVGAKASNENYLEFYGIPYAGSVSGDHRFKVSKKVVTFYCIQNNVIDYWIYHVNDSCKPNEQYNCINIIIACFRLTA